MSKPRRELPDPAISRLDPSHERDAFDCGNQTLNRYLSSIATQDLRRGLAVPYVMTLPPSREVVGYFTLAASSIDLVELPAPVRRRLPPGVVIGASLLGRLAAAAG